MNSGRISVGIISLVLLASVADQTVRAATQSRKSVAPADSSFEQRLSDAERALRAMGEQPAAIKSVHYHVLYVCRRAFAEQRKTILEATRRNFLGFMRRLKVKINPKHDKLLVIVLESHSKSPPSISLWMLMSVHSLISPVVLSMSRATTGSRTMPRVERAPPRTGLLDFQRPVKRMLPRRSTF